MKDFRKTINRAKVRLIPYMPVITALRLVSSHKPRIFVSTVGINFLAMPYQ